MQLVEGSSLVLLVDAAGSGAADGRGVAALAICRHVSSKHPCAALPDFTFDRA
jgi:hypothetical protein